MFCCHPFKGRRQRGDWGDTWRVKVVVVGDSQCGKTSLIQRHCCGTLPSTYTPTLFDSSSTSWQVEGRKVQMIIQDTAGQEDLDRLRPPFYLHTDVIIVCFAADKPDSWEKVRKVWVPETRRYCGKHVPVLLVANKTDLAVSSAGQISLRHPRLPGHGQGSSFVDPRKPSVEASGSLTFRDCTAARDDEKDKRSSGRDSGFFESMEHLAPYGANEEKRSLLGHSHCRADKKKQSSSDRRPDSGRQCRSKVEQVGAASSDLQIQAGAGQHDSTEHRGPGLAAQIGAVGYFETSAVLGQGVQQVFEAALTAAMASKQWRKKYRL